MMLKTLLFLLALHHHGRHPKQTQEREMPTVAVAKPSPFINLK